MHANRYVELEREAAVAGDMIRMRVRLENGGELDAMALAFVQALLDRGRGICGDRRSGLLVADQVGGTPEVVVDELLEEHERDRSNRRGYISGSALAWSSSSNRQTYQPIASRKTSVCSPFITIPPRFWSRIGDNPQSLGVCS